MAISYGSVYKLSGNRRKPFIARITIGWEDGKQIFQTVGYFKSRKEATIALAEYNKNPYDINIKKLSFSDVYEKWSSRKFPDLSKNRVEQYKSIYQSLSEFHSLTFSDLRTINIQDYFDKRTDISSASLIHYKALFNQMYKYAIKHEIVDKNYAEHVEIKKTEKAAPHKIFTEEEIWTLWDNHEDKDVQLVLILIYTGMRIMELLTIKQKNVFIEERYMIGGMKTEAGKDRIIPISKKILPFIESWLDGSEFLIRKQNKGKSAAYTYHGFRHAIWKPVLKRFNLEHSIHDTRHTAISLMDAAGVNKTAIKRIVGHKNEDVTESYTHKNVADLVQEIDKI